MTPTNNKLKVQDVEISLATIDNQDYISLTDMAKGKNDEARAADIIKNWIRNRSHQNFQVLGKYFITLILKWSNSTTLKKKQDCQHLLLAFQIGQRVQMPLEFYYEKGNIESLNASLIKNNVAKEERFKILVETIKE